MSIFILLLIIVGLPIIFIGISYFTLPARIRIIPYFSNIFKEKISVSKAIIIVIVSLVLIRIIFFLLITRFPI